MRNNADWQKLDGDGDGGQTLFDAWLQQPAGVNGFRPLDIAGYVRVNGARPVPGWHPAQCVRCRGWTLWRRYGGGDLELACGTCGRRLATYCDRPDKDPPQPAAAKNPVVSAEQKAALEWLSQPTPAPTPTPTPPAPTPARGHQLALAIVV